MATKKSPQNEISPELQSFIDEIAARYQPGPEAQHRLIENAEARYTLAQRLKFVSGKTFAPGTLIGKSIALL
ncbi:hypothetical protein MX657_03820 [Enterobacter chuandaensis]|uniref:hypothetical protein n=1 Tax=Enterobacter chuandaensis TaxID=2497875 RepID=UPI00321734CF